MLEDLHDAIYMMNDTPKPFVAGIQGAAGGAGMSLVSAFDLVVSVSQQNTQWRTQEWVDS